MRFEDFIYFNDDALSLDESNKIVNFVKQNRKTFELFSVDQKQVTKYNRSKAKQDDFWFYVEMFGTFPKDLVNMMGDCLKEGIAKYCEKYPHANTNNFMNSPRFKYHIVGQGQGYHVYHQEWGPSPNKRDTILAWHLSLTSHENEGELEFLYYGKKVIPKAGRLLIWPAYFTHTHKGHIIKKNTQKHYTTGWFYSV